VTCQECGRALNAGARFCPMCGTAVPDIATDAPFPFVAPPPPPALAPPPPPPLAPYAPPPAPPPPPLAPYAPPPAPPGTNAPPPASPSPIAQGYPPPAYGYARPTKTNGLAIASMVLGILWIYWIGSILALVFGYVAKGQIDRSGGAQTGRGMAVAGIVLGWVGIGLLVIAIVAARAAVD
jgi:uncharacterized membrane protein